MHVLDLLVKVRTHLPCGMTERCSGTDEGCLIVERFTRVGDESRRDTERVTDQEHRTRRVPSRVTTCLKGVTYSAGGERRRVRFLLVEAVSAEFFDQRTVLECEEGVVLLGGTTGQRLKPVREMRGTPVHRPFADTDRYDAGDVAVDRATVIHIVEQLIQHFLRDIFLHLLPCEHIGSEIVLYFAFRHIHYRRFMLKGGF